MLRITLFLFGTIVLAGIAFAPVNPEAFGLKGIHSILTALGGGGASFSVATSVAAGLLLLTTTVIFFCAYFFIYVKKNPEIYASVAVARQWANTIYYLGFFGTLVSLISTIVSFGSMEENVEITVLFGNAALAISTTAAAIVLRTLWMIHAQGCFNRPTPDADAYAKSIAKLAGSLAELTENTALAKKALSDFKADISNLKIDPNAVSSALTTGFDKALAPTIASQQAFSGVFSSASSSLGGLNTRFGTAEKKLKTLEEQIDQLAESFNRAATDAAGLRKPGFFVRVWRALFGV